MDVAVKPSSVSGEVTAPPSKSYTHRAILSGLYSDKLEIENPLLSEDTYSSIESARLLGANVEVTDSENLKVKGVDGVPETPGDVMDCGNSGTTLRLFMSAAALQRGKAVLTGDGSLRQRPNDPLINSLEELGGYAESTRRNGKAPVIVGEGIKGGSTTIDGSVSSQFISSLLFAAPFTSDEDVAIEIDGELISEPYVDITLEVLDSMGVEAARTDTGYSVENGQVYRSDSFRVPGDFSSASYPLAAAAMTGSVKALNLYPSAQGDSYILRYLGSMGVDVTWKKEEGIAIIESNELDAVDFDASDNPDLVPTVAVLASKASGETRVFNAEHLRYKETNRLDAITTELRKMGVEVEETSDGLVVDGDESSLSGATVDSWGDHRIAMALVVAGLSADGDTLVRDTDSVDVSYPGFIESMSGIGADVTVVE